MERTRWLIHLSHRSEPEPAPVVMVIYIERNLWKPWMGMGRGVPKIWWTQKCTTDVHIHHTFTSSYEVTPMQVDAVKSESKLDGLKPKIDAFIRQEAGVPQRTIIKQKRHKVQICSSVIAKVETWCRVMLSYHRGALHTHNCSLTSWTPVVPMGLCS